MCSGCGGVANSSGVGGGASCSCCWGFMVEGGVAPCKQLLWGFGAIQKGGREKVCSSSVFQEG